MALLKKNAIITCADARAGDFLADHWLVSLITNVDLSETDIVILDYGLTDEMKKRIHARSSAQIIPCKKDGGIVVIRFRDMGAFLKGSHYEQVLSCDGGDIIFQSDISHLFREYPSKFRVVSEGHYVPFHSTQIRRTQRNVNQHLSEEIFRATYEKRSINGGFLLAPRDEMLRLCDFIFSNVSNKNSFGPDQILIGYFFYTHGFHSLDSRYNFILYTNEESFRIHEGKFFGKNGDVIPVIHNAGRFSWVRVINNFGFGPERNHLKRHLYYSVRFLIYFSSLPRQKFMVKAFSPLARLKNRVIHAIS